MNTSINIKKDQFSVFLILIYLKKHTFFQFEFRIAFKLSVMSNHDICAAIFENKLRLIENRKPFVAIKKCSEIVNYHFLLI